MSVALVNLLQRNSLCHCQLLEVHYTFFFFSKDIDKYCDALRGIYFKKCNANFILVQNYPVKKGKAIPATGRGGPQVARLRGSHVF
jgi:hypothetical protein